MKALILSVVLSAGIVSAQAQVFEENMGSVTENTKIADHHAGNGFQNSSKLTFSGSAEVQNMGGATASNTYKTLSGNASGGANIRIADVPGADFVISGINTKDIESPTVAFGVLKGLHRSNGSDLALEYSLDGKKWIRINFPPLPTGEGSSLVWMYRIASTPLPQVKNLAIRFRQTGGGSVFRIDDVSVISQPE